MRRIFPAGVMLAAAVLLLTASARTQAQDKDWSTIKGRIVWGGDKLPEERWITVTVDPAACLAANKTAKDGKILDEALIVNAKNKGIKNVFIYLIEDPANPLPVHPKMKDFPKDITIDQPACMFFPRALTMREGQVFVVKNGMAVQHNIRWIGDGVNNQGGNVTIKGGDKAEVKDLKAQRLPLPLECNIHGWMKGRLGVFAHPYYALTDENGNFEIKLAPVGNYKIMIYHEDIGYRLGAKGKNGEDITIKAGATDMGDLNMGK